MSTRPREFSLQLDSASSDPLGVQVTKAMVVAIKSGRLKPGDSLPGSRQLAETLGVHRNTVLWALKELEAEGWVETRERFGTFVAARLPEQTPRIIASQEIAVPKPGVPGFDLPTHLQPITAPIPSLMDLSEGLPDPRLAPTDALAKAYQRALRLHGDDLLKHGEPHGNLALRKALAELLSERRGLAVDAEQILITRGSRMALDLLTATLLANGGAVAVEDPGNPAVWELLRIPPRVEVVPVPVDHEGMDIAALESLLEKRKLTAVFLTPNFHYPTTVSLSDARRRQLLLLAQKHRVAIIEDEYASEYAYESPRLPLASLDKTGQVIYMGSLSKLLAPGVHLGFLVAQKPMIELMARVRRGMEHPGDRVLEWAVADLWRDGDISRHLRKVRKTYQERRDFFAELLRDKLGGAIEAPQPEGGLSFWAKVAPGMDAEAWVDRCRNRGLIFHTGRRYSYAGADVPYVRMGFASLDPTQMNEAVRRMASAL